MSRGAVIALSVAGVVAVGALAYYLATHKGPSASGAINSAGHPSADIPPPAGSSPETTWGGRAVALANHALDQAPDIIDSIQKFF